METIIESNIPAPQKGKWDKKKYPFEKLEVGQSFFVENSKETVYAIARHYRVKHPGWDYVVRKEKNGARIWRIQ